MCNSRWRSRTYCAASGWQLQQPVALAPTPPPRYKHCASDGQSLRCSAPSSRV